MRQAKDPERSGRQDAAPWALNTPRRVLRVPGFLVTAVEAGAAGPDASGQDGFEGLRRASPHWQNVVDPALVGGVVCVCLSLGSGVSSPSQSHGASKASWCFWG